MYMLLVYLQSIATMCLYVCLSVCFVSKNPQPHVQIAPNFLYLWPPLMTVQCII